MWITDKTARLEALGIDANVLDNYLQPHRFYHTIAHLDDIFSQLDAQGHSGNDALILATVFHDIIYDPKSATNEEDSAACLFVLNL